MGLDFSHTHAYWAYSAFHRFREALAKHEGIHLNAMAGFHNLRCQHEPDDHPNIPWDNITTPLKPLLDHSDCDGELTPAECAQVAPRLREVVPLIWPDPDDYDHRHGMLLADGMDAAAAASENLELR